MMSYYLQYLCCFLGHQFVFRQAEEMFSVMSGITVTDKQIERVCHHYGEAFEQDYADGELVEKSPGLKTSNAALVYVMFDGGMILSRDKEHAWKEFKLARIFMQSNHVKNVSKDKGVITQSFYISHLGSSNAFFRKLEPYTECLNRKKMIFIADGAVWIWKWIDDLYEESIQILDYYHATEYLFQFAALHFSGQKEKTGWIKQMEKLLLNDDVAKVIARLEGLLKSIKKQKVKEELLKLIQYYRNNEKRMKYKTFRDNGYLIGSGAMESAIRNVIQQRLKKSGQRWTIAGAQQVGNLRTLFLSNMHEVVRQKIAG